MIRRLASAFTAGPAYPMAEEDRRIVRVLGLDLPLRASLAILIMTLVVLFDFTRTAIPEDIQAIGRAAQEAGLEGLLAIPAAHRACLYGSR